MDVLEDYSMLSDDGFEDPPNRPLVPKAVSPSVHKSKFDQQSALSLKQLSDQVDVIAKINKCWPPSRRK